MKKFPNLIFIVIILISCSFLSRNGGIDYSSEVEKYEKERQLSHYQDIANQDDISQLVNEIALENKVYERSVGFMDKYTRTYARYERLVQIAKYNDFISLLKHDSTAVRTYAAMALIQDDSNNLKVVKEHILNPDEFVSYSVGCMTIEIPIKLLIK